MLNLEICIYSKQLNDKFEPGQVAAESSMYKFERNSKCILVSKVSTTQ